MTPDFLNFVTRVLFAETASFKPDPTSPKGLENLRLELAGQIAASGNGAGFAEPREPTIADLAQPDTFAAWQACGVAAQAAGTRLPALTPNCVRVVYFASANPSTDPNLTNEHKWLRAATMISSAGPALGIDATKIELFTFDVPSRELNEPGRYPRTGAYPPVVYPGEFKAGFRRPLVGTVLFVVVLGWLIYSGYWAISDSHSKVKGLPEQAESAGKRASAAKLIWERADAEAKAAPADKGLAAASEKAKLEYDALQHTYQYSDLAPLRKQEDAWKQARDLASRAPGDSKLLEERERQHGQYLKLRQTYEATIGHRLYGPWIMFSIGLLALMMLVSWGLAGNLLGFLVDERRRMSLARFQFAVWTLVILGGYWTLAMWNMGTGPEARLPAMQADLWILLGIVIGSPLTSSLILSMKSAPAGATSQSSSQTTDRAPSYVAADAVGTRGDLDIRKRDGAWGFLDMFAGEERVNRSTIDLSRLQQFVFTLVVVMAYITLLGQTLKTLLPGFVVDMPSLDATLLGLLAVSHAAYLAAKALPKPLTGGPAP